jgi:hypothetical protein
MSAARIAPLIAEPANAANKVVALHHFAHEEQIKNTDQGRVVVSRERKHLLPASDLAKMSESQLALLSLASKKEEMIAKLQSIGSTLATHISQLAKALAGNSTASAGSQKDPAGDSGFDPWNSSILLLYTAFAVNQMNQNGKVMNGWEAQQQAQNQILQETADAEAINAHKAENTTTNTACWWKSLLIGLGVFVAVLAGVAITVASGGMAAPAGIALAAVVGGALLAGGGAFAASYCPTAANPNSAASAPLTQSGPDQQLIQQISNSNIFWNTISQETNNAITTGSQTNLVSASSNDTQLGQQAAQVIQSMGQIMQTPVAH